MTDAGPARAGRPTLSRPDWRALGVAGLHLSVLWSFAFAQPLLDLLGDAPEFFVARDNTRDDIILLALGVTLVPPLALTALEAVVAVFSERARRGLHLLLVGALAAAFVLQLLKDWPGGPGAVLLALALALGALAGLLYARSRAGTLMLTVLSPAPLVFLALFLLASPTADLVLPGAKAETSNVTFPRRPPIVMIVFDELSGAALMQPDGGIDASRFPNFARLAGDSTWFRNASTVADSTERAVPALLSGDVADQSAAPIASNYPHSLFTLLGGRYSFEVTERLTDVCPQELCPAEAAGRLPAKTRLRQLGSDLSVVSLRLLLPDDLADGLPSVERSFGDFRATGGGEDPGAGVRGFAAVAAMADRQQQFHEFVKRLGRAPREAHLSFLHVALPHNPYHFMPNGQRYPDPSSGVAGLESGAPAGKWGSNRWLARQALQRYLLQLSYSDRLLGEALARLRSTGRYDRSLVVVVADHGVSFKPGEAFRDVRPGNVVSIASVPFFVKAPGQRRGRVEDGNVRTADVLPTVAAELGVGLPWSVDGRVAGDRATGGRLDVSPQHGDAGVTLGFEEFVRRRDGLVGEIAAAFGRGLGGLYRAGPDDDIVGRPVTTLATTPAPGARFELDSGGLLGDVDPAAPVVPAFLTGGVSGIPSGARLAVAVNGRVRAVTRSYSSDEGTRFAAIVPPSSFRRGANTVELLAVTGPGARRSFGVVRSAGRSFRLVEDGGRRAIVAAGGRRIPVVAGAAGYVEDLEVGGTEIRIGGWAGITEPPRSASLVLAFAGERFIGATRPSKERSDLAQKFGSQLRRAGFSLSAGRLDGEMGTPTVRVYAIIGDQAVELRQGRSAVAPHDRPAPEQDSNLRPTPYRNRSQALEAVGLSE